MASGVTERPLKEHVAAEPGKHVKKQSVKYEHDPKAAMPDPAEVADYLNAALDDGSQDVFLMALREVANASGIRHIARETSLNRENIYRILSEKGNPRLSSLKALLDSLGLKLAVKAKQPAIRPKKQVDMTARARAVKCIKDAYPYLSANFGVERVGIFGSVARGDAGEGSDIDLIVDLKRPVGLRFIELVAYLESIFNRKVDVLTRAGLENIRIKAVAEDIERNISWVLEE